MRYLYISRYGFIDHLLWNQSYTVHVSNLLQANEYYIYFWWPSILSKVLSDTSSSHFYNFTFDLNFFSKENKLS